MATPLCLIRVYSIWTLRGRFVVHGISDVVISATPRASEVQQLERHSSGGVRGPLCASQPPMESRRNLRLSEICAGFRCPRYYALTLFERGVRAYEDMDGSDQLDEWDVLDDIGKGGQGVVYKARHKESGAEAA